MPSKKTPFEIVYGGDQQKKNVKNKKSSLWPGKFRYDGKTPLLEDHHEKKLRAMLIFGWSVEDICQTLQLSKTEWSLVSKDKERNWRDVDHARRCCLLDVHLSLVEQIKAGNTKAMQWMLENYDGSLRELKELGGAKLLPPLDINIRMPST